MQTIHTIAWFYWNPPREAFTIPYLNHPVAWYGILFVLGFILSYFLINPIFARFIRQTKSLSYLDILNWAPITEALLNSTPSPIAQNLWHHLDTATKTKLKTLNTQHPLDLSIKASLLKGLNWMLDQPDISREDLEKAFPKAIATARQTAFLLTDKLCWFVILGTVIGARLGEVFFYSWPEYQHNPIEIFKIWKGGLASHGGTLGVALSLYCFTLYIRKWIPSLNFLRLMDYVAIPSPFVAFFIRMGNFVNQEILGLPTDRWLGVVFGNPADGSFPIPRHPVQLYEGLSYLAIFVFLYAIWYKRGEQLRQGTFCGLMFILLFASRFILEFWKTEQASALSMSYLQAGQLLSIPFIVFGWFLLLRPDSPQEALTKPGKILKLG